jgi:hypothetical protein
MDYEPNKIAALKDELRKDLEALERVERLMRAKSDPETPQDRRKKPTAAVQERPSEPEAQEPESEIMSGSLRATIATIINNSESTTRWTPRKVLSKLEEMKYDLRSKQPVYSVGQALKILAKRGDIKLARKGSGSAPNIYRSVNAGSNQPERQPVNLFGHALPN